MWCFHVDTIENNITGYNSLIIVLLYMKHFSSVVSSSWDPVHKCGNWKILGKGKMQSQQLMWFPLLSDVVSKEKTLTYPHFPVLCIPPSYYRSSAQYISSWLKNIFSVGFLFSQNDQSTEDLHILGAEDLSFLAEKVVFPWFKLLFLHRVNRIQTLRTITMSYITIKQTHSSMELV